MTQPNQSSAFELLQSLARRGNEQGSNLSVQDEAEAQWRGVGFQLAGNQFIASMTEVDEVLYMQDCTRFPGVKPWVIGVANVRGRLLSVIDLGLFFGGKSSASSKRCRILTIKQDDLYTGVVVEDVMGIQALGSLDQVEEVSVEEKYKPYVNGGFEQDQRNWTIFSLSKLVSSPEYLQVAG